MKIITDSIWYCSHPEKLNFLEKNKGIYKLIFNSDESGKINLCINMKLQRKDESKNIPLAKFLIDKEYITQEGHYYVDYKDGNQYSIFYKHDMIYPFSDRVCSEHIVKQLKRFFAIEDTQTIVLGKEDLKLVKNKEIMIKMSTVIKIILGIFTSSTLASLAYFFL